VRDGFEALRSQEHLLQSFGWTHGRKGSHRRGLTKPILPGTPSQCFKCELTLSQAQHLHLSWDTRSMLQMSADNVTSLETPSFLGQPMPFMSAGNFTEQRGEAPNDSTRDLGPNGDSQCRKCLLATSRNSVERLSSTAIDFLGTMETYKNIRLSTAMGLIVGVLPRAAGSSGSIACVLAP